MNPLKALTTPEYLFRPRMIVHRFRRALLGSFRPEFETVTLPWRAKIRIRPGEVVGSGIWCYGVFDLTVTEALCRLLDNSETAIDIGANIGQMTSLMRHRVGNTGKVISFEPHPEVFSELCYNIENQSEEGGCGQVELHNVALSDKQGEAYLEVDESWSTNRGTARLSSNTLQDPQGMISVRMARLDEMVGDRAAIGVCKIDVEGHELAVLKGAERLLANRRIRDVIFEELNAFPTAVHKLFLDSGFTVFSLHSRIWGPRLVPASALTSFTRMQDGKNYLATLDPGRALSRFGTLGWKTLQGGN